jgi:outer membrane lipoprotein carrier protein
MFLPLVVALGLVIPVAAPVAVAKKASPATIVAEVQKRYASVTQMTVAFRQSITNVTFGVTKVSDGELRLVRPDKMRWDYFSKAPQIKKSFLGDGKTLHVVDHDNREVITKRVADDLLQIVIAFVYGKGDLKGTHHALLDASGKYGTKSDLVLKLTPKKPAVHYKTLYLVIDKTDYRVTQSIVIDASGNVNHLTFQTADLTTPIDASAFVLDTTATQRYRVIDATQP